VLSIRPQCFSPAEKQCRRLRRFANLQRTAQMTAAIRQCDILWTRCVVYVRSAGTVIEADCQTSSTVCAFKNPRVAEGSFFGSAGRPSVNATSFLRGTGQSSSLMQLARVIGSSARAVNRPLPSRRTPRPRPYERSHPKSWDRNGRLWTH
jgi:hypothetical protein